MKLFVGLGNPGSGHAQNRHNVGFMAVERIASEHNFGPWKKKFHGLISDGRIGGERVLLLKPQTYMNDSGRSVVAAQRFHKLDEGDIVVFYDEIDLAPAKLKVKTGGGNAGHNGLRSLSAHVGNDFVRVRIGVGHPGNKDLVADYVLRDFSKSDRAWLEPLIDAIAGASGRLAADDASRFLTDVNTALGIGGSKKATKKRAGEAKQKPKSTPQAQTNVAKPDERHRGSALTEALKNWIAGRASKDEG